MMPNTTIKTREHPMRFQLIHTKFSLIFFLSSFKKGQQITQKQQDTGNYPQYFGVPPAWCDKPNNKADNCNYGNHNVCYISFTHFNPDLQT